MSCRDFEKLALELARHRPLDAARRESGLAHAHGCRRCAERLRQERALIAGVRAAAADIAMEEAPARVEAALLAAFRQQLAAPATAQIPRAKGGWRWQRGVVAAGVLLLLSVLAAFWLAVGSQSRQPEQRAIPPASPPEQQASTDGPPSSPDKNTDDKIARPPRRQRSVRRQPVRQELPETEIVTEFFPLFDGDDLSALESTQIVRVELPGSALLEAGFLIDARTASAPVKADVVLGPDGLARAIRFVR